MKIASLIALVGLIATPALADNMTGKFKGRGDGTVELSVKSTVKGLQTEISTSDKGCTGGVEGIAQITAPDTLKLSKRDDPDQPMCNITMVYHGKHVTVTSDGCSYFHGASCGFESELKKK